MVTVIEALRAFDIVYIVNKGRNGLELLSVLVTNNIIGEASRIGFGSAIAVILLVISSSRSSSSSGTASGRPSRRDDASAATGDTRRASGSAAPRTVAVVLHAFLIVTASSGSPRRLGGVHLAAPVLGHRASTATSRGRTRCSLDNYRNAWDQGDMPPALLQLVLITIPAIVLILLFASAVAFVVSRFSFWFNVPLLIFFTAGEPAAAAGDHHPLYQMYLRIPLPDVAVRRAGSLYDSFIGLIAIHVAFQTGFCTFVLTNYMKTLPK